MVSEVKLKAPLINSMSYVGTRKNKASHYEISSQFQTTASNAARACH